MTSYDKHFTEIKKAAPVQKAPLRQSKTQRDAGRIRIPVLRVLLAENAASAADDDLRTIQELASKYEVDAKALRNVLRYMKVVDLQGDKSLS